MIDCCYHCIVTVQRNKQKKTGSKDSSSGASTISTAEMRTIMEKLKNKRVRDTTKKNYYSVWKSFNKFFLQLDEKPENWEDRLTLFVTYLIEIKKVQSQTVKSYISALKNILLDDGYEISTSSFLLASLTKACRLQNDRVRTRLPIQKKLLHEIVKFVVRTFRDQNQPYLAAMYKVLFLTAYYGLLRVSEVTATPGMHSEKVQDIRMGQNKDKILFILRSSKTHGLYMTPQLVKIATENNNKDKCYCPFTALYEYIQLRPGYIDPSEQFFVFKDRTPVSSLHMQSTLHVMLQAMGYRYELYNCHSFRVG